MKHFYILSICLILLVASTVSSAAYPRAGYEANLSTLFHNVSGTVTIVDADTLLLEGFNYDSGGPAVYFYLATEDSNGAFTVGLSVGPLLTGTVYTNDELIVHLPPATTLDGYNAISVWCEDVSVNFGSGTFVDMAPHVAWTFDHPTTQSYVLDAYQPNEIPFGTLGDDDPTLLLELGKRYQVTIVNSTIHPFEVLAKGPDSTQDTVLLSMKTDTGVPLESDSEIAWEDDGVGTASFTLTQDLYAAMLGGGINQTPGYRCGIHVSSMRGDFGICLDKPIGDLDGNCVINLLDFSLFAQDWLVNGIPIYDQDGDGFISSAYGGYDCDDTNPNIHPAALEIPGNLVDENCNDTIDDTEICDNGLDDDADFDIDCDDSDCNVFPDCLP